MKDGVEDFEEYCVGEGGMFITDVIKRYKKDQHTLIDAVVAVVKGMEPHVRLVPKEDKESLEKIMMTQVGYNDLKKGLVNLLQDAKK